MESVGQRMTRSRAKALGTPMVEALHRTPEPKTTGRRRRGAPQQQPEEPAAQEPKQLQFADQAADKKGSNSNSPSSSSADASGTSNSPVDLAVVQASETEASTNPDTHDNASTVALSLAPAPADELPVPDEEPPAAQDPSNSQPLPEEPVQSSPAPAPSPAPVPVQASPLAVVPPSPLVHDRMDMSPLPVARSPLSLAAESPLPTASPAPLPIAASPIPPAASPLPPPAASPLAAAAAAAAASPMQGVVAMEASPLPARTPLSFTSDAPGTAGPSAQPPAAASIPATPLSITESMLEAIEHAQFSPMPDEDAAAAADNEGDDGALAGSPISLSGAAALTPMAVTPIVHPHLHQHQEAGQQLSFEQQFQQPQHHQGVEAMDEDAAMADVTPLPAAAPSPSPAGAMSMAVSPMTFVSDCRATPVADPSPVAGFVVGGGVQEEPGSVPHSAAPAGGSTFQGFAAALPQMAAEPQSSSPSLDGLLSAATLAAVPSPAPFSAASDHPDACNLPSSTTGLGTPSAAAAAAATCVPPPPPESTAAPTPVDASSHLRAPAPTPACGSTGAASWSLTGTPLANAIAASLSTTTEAACCAEATPTCGGDTQAAAQPAAATSDKAAAADDEAAAAANNHEDTMMDDMMEDVQIPQPAAATPVPASAATAAKTPTAASVRTAGVPARSPLVGSVMRGGASRTTPLGKTPTGIRVSAPSASKPAGSSYVFVESRYNKTPASKAPGASATPSGAGMTTPSAITNVTAGAKSIKRVSIHTPEGPRTAGGQQRPQVVPTPYRPKAAQPAAPQQQQQQQPEAPAPVEAAPATAPVDVAQLPEAATANERRAKAAERLKAIHSAEQAPSSAAPAAHPGYLAPTQAFAVRSAKTAAALKSKVEAGGYDPRSLRQLKREVKDAIAKKEAKAAATAAPAATAAATVPLSEARESKLTPRVPERHLPMPDDDEMSEDEAVYDQDQENDLVDAMTGLEVAPNKQGAHVALRGLPAPTGRHLRFGEKGQVEESPQRVVLRGLPVAVGKYKRFD